MGILSSIKKTAVKVLDANQAAFSSPITTITKGINAGIAETKSKSTSQNVKSIIKNTVIAGAAVATLGTTTGRAAVAKVAKAAVPTTPKGIITAAVLTPIAVGAVSRDPKQAIKTTVKAPGELSQFGGDLMSLATNPTPTTAKDLISRSPYLSSAAALLLLGTAGKTVAPIVGGVINKNALDNQTEAIKEQTQVLKEPGTTKGIQPVTVIDKSSEFVKESPTAPVTPIMPQTNTVTSGTSKVRRKARRKPVLPNMIQKVNVLVSNNNTHKRYIKGAAVAF